MTDNDRQKYRGLCVTCKHWTGDRERQLAKANEYPECMDRDHGWPADASCSEHPYELEVIGDAIGRVTFNANFGCILWESVD